MNALSGFLITSLFFVIGTMVEFAVVLLIKRLSDLKSKKGPKGPLFESKPNNKKKDATNEELENDESDIPYSLTDKIDFVSLFIFMASYLIFTISYFVYYLNLD